MIRTVSLAVYLGHRLRQLGVGHLFGVPGDFNLTLLDELHGVEGLDWAGSPNELGAGYAADAYARNRGLAALVTTYGVGELSCFNAVAGSAAEDVPVIHIVGSPSTAAVRDGRLVHHTLADGVFGRFEEAYRQVTVAQETVTWRRAAEQVDAVLLAAITHCRPAYLSIPQDLATLPVDAAPLAQPLRPLVDAPASAEFTARLSELLEDAHQPVFVVGHLVSRFGMADPVLRAARNAGIPLVTSLAAKGVIDEDEPLHRGDYAGTMVDASTARLVGEADLVLELGTVPTDVLSGFFTHRPVDAQTVRFAATTVTIGSDDVHPVRFPDAIGILADLCPVTENAPPVAVPPASPVVIDPEDALTQETLWRTVEDWLPPGTALLADTGTAFWGAVSMRLPPDTVMHAQPIWNSIGWSLPATLGQGLADPGRRPVLFIGDGAIQMTLPDLSAIARAGLTPIIVLLSNDGYTIERALQSPDAAYNDIAAWDWDLLVPSLAGPKASHRIVGTPGQLRAALDDAPSDALVVIEALLDKHDVPALLRVLAERNGGGA